MTGSNNSVVVKSTLNRTNWQNGSINPEKKVSCCVPIAFMAIGIITFLGGVFLTLALHQVLPHGLNAISELGVPGKLASYGSLGLGAIFSLVGAVKLYLIKRDREDSPESQLILYAQTSEVPDSPEPQLILSAQTSEVPESLGNTIKLNLKFLKIEKPEAFFDLVQKCRNPSSGFRDTSKTVLKKRTFINEDEEIYEPIKSIVLSCVERGDSEMKLSLPRWIHRISQVGRHSEFFGIT